MADRSASPTTPTLPEHLQEPSLDSPDVVTGLRVHGNAFAVHLPRQLERFTIGSSPDRELALADEFVSALHCVVERRGPRLRVLDQTSHNGTYFRGRREATFDVEPGDTFSVASTRLLAMSDEMAASYPVFADILGGDAEACDLLVTATYGGHLLVTGEYGCDQDRLARAIHAASLRRGRPLVELAAIPRERAAQREILDRAAKSTIVIALGAKSPVADATFCSMLFSSSFHIRVVALAPTVAKATDVLGLYSRNMQHVALHPLAQRAGAIPHLLDGMFAEGHSTLRFADLAPPNRAALSAYRWHDNFAGLRTAATRLTAIAREGSLRRAADALGISASTLHYWFTQLGCSLPLRNPTDSERGSRRWYRHDAAAQMR